MVSDEVVVVGNKNTAPKELSLPEHSLGDAGPSASTRVKRILLRRKEAANYLREEKGVPVAAQTLAKLAVNGGGPKYRKFGRFPLYDPGDLDCWAESKLGPKQLSTSDRRISMIDNLPPNDRPDKAGRR